MDRAEALKLVYGASLAITALAAGRMALCEVPGLFAHGMSALLSSIQIFAVLCFGIVAVPLWMLSRKSRWWGKLLLLACGVSWMAHGAALPFVAAPMGAHILVRWLPVLCGVGMLVLASAHQFIDPSCSR